MLKYTRTINTSFTIYLKHLRHFCTQGTETEYRMDCSQNKFRRKGLTLQIMITRTNPLNVSFYGCDTAAKRRGRETYCGRLWVVICPTESQMEIRSWAYRSRDGSLQFYRPVLSQDLSTCTELRKGKVVPLQAWTNPYGSRRLRLPEILDNWQMKVGKAVSPTHRPPLPPGDIAGTHFCQKLSRPQRNSEAARINSMKNPNDLTGNRNRDMSATAYPTELSISIFFFFVFCWPCILV